MTIRMLLIAGAVLLAVDAAAQGDPGIPDTVKIDSVTAYTTGSGVAPVRFYNDQTLSGIEVTLTWGSPAMSVDSFSFAGSRVGYTTLRGSKFDDSSITIYSFPFTGQPLIGAGNGLLGRIYFSYPQDIGSTVVPVDTTRLAVGQRAYATMFSSATNVAYSPQFRRGFVDIKDTVCCVGMRGNVDNDPTDNADVADITYLVTYLFLGGPAPVCTEEANADGDIAEGVNVADLTFLVSYSFLGGAAPPPCP